MPFALIYDTETTGLPLFRDPSDDPRQPHIVEIAAGLYDLESGECAKAWSTIVAPDGWIIPDDVVEIHGITTERATAEGIPEAEALLMFDELRAEAQVRVGHNESFDARILRIAYKRFRGVETADAWKAEPAECTCRMATPILSLPPTERMRQFNFKGAKSANLTECIKHFFNEDHTGAHGAGPDRDACARVYFHIKSGRYLSAALTGEELAS